MSKLKIAVIIGSTRDSRFGPKPAQWILNSHGSGNNSTSSWST